MILGLGGRSVRPADNAGSLPQSYDGVKHCQDEMLCWLKYESGNGDTNASEEERDERESMTTTGVDRSSALPRLTACLSLMLTVLLSKHSSAERICEDITDTFEDTFGPALDLLAENLPSWSNGGGHCHPADLLAVFGHPWNCTSFDPRGCPRGRGCWDSSHVQQSSQIVVYHVQFIAEGAQMKRRHSVISTPTRMMAALPGATRSLVHASFEPFRRQRWTHGRR